LKALRIVIPGGSGQVGKILARYFHGNGHAVTVLARRASSTPWQNLNWDATTLGSWTKALDAADVVINLAGRNVNCRYNEANRREILLSRTETTSLIGQAIAKAANPPALWINASTATIYRHTFDRPMDETTGELGGAEDDVPATWRFSIDVAASWEHAFFEASTPRTRKIAVRSAMTMSPDKDGVFDVLLRLVRLGLGGSAGSGRQFVSWIHEADFVRAIEFLIEHEVLEGAVNLAAPNPLPNKQFMRALRSAWGTPIGIPAARWMLEIGALFLCTETELILKSRRVVPGRLLSSGFTFEFPEWPIAARDLVHRWRSVRGL